MGRRKARTSAKAKQWYDGKLNRASKHGADYEFVDAELVFIRDKWVCQICGKNMLPSLTGKGTPKSPTLDHIVPISEGGSHTYQNLQAAHRICNMKKANSLLDK